MIQPPNLKPGDKVAITAPASKVDYQDIEPALTYLKSWGYEVVVGHSVGNAFFGFAANDDARKHEFQQLIDDPSVSAILCARGGYGCSRFIDSLDWTNFRVSPKWVVGFSDITALHGLINGLGIQSIHGPMAKTFSWDEPSAQYLNQLWKGDPIQYHFGSHELNRPGSASGSFLGGNLCLVANGLGTPSELDFTGAILFLEDIGETHYNLDRLMVQLKRAGKLKNLSGAVIGQFNEMKLTDEPFGKSAEEIVSEHLAEVNIPVAFNAPIGHTRQNWPVRCGELVNLVVGPESTKISSLFSI